MLCTGGIAPAINLLIGTALLKQSSLIPTRYFTAPDLRNGTKASYEGIAFSAWWSILALVCISAAAAPKVGILLEIQCSDVTVLRQIV